MCFLINLTNVWESLINFCVKKGKQTELQRKKWLIVLQNIFKIFANVESPHISPICENKIQNSNWLVPTFQFWWNLKFRTNYQFSQIFVLLERKYKISEKFRFWCLVFCFFLKQSHMRNTQNFKKWKENSQTQM